MKFHSIQTFKLLFFFVSCFFLPLPATTKADPPQAKIRGEYLISEITKLENGEFKVIFKALSPQKNFDQLLIVCQNLHFEMKANQVLTIAAEYVGAPAPKNELTQALIFLPGNTYKTPVWIMSTRHAQSSLNASKFIEMHAPATDYQVF